MFEADIIVGDEMAPIPEGEAITSRQNAPKAHALPVGARSMTWGFFGKHAMPDAEHLIPFLN